MSKQARRTYRAASPLLLAVLASAGAAFAADEPAAKFPTNEDLRHVRSMSHPRLSPDGKQVIVEVTDATADGGKGHLWLVDVDKNSSRQITFTPAGGKTGEGSGEWMPDGHSIVFTAHRGDHTRLFRLPMAGGEAQPFDLKLVPPVDVSTAADAVPPKDPKQPAEKKTPDAVVLDVSYFAIAPDGKTIAIVARDPETPGEKKQKDDKADAVWVNHEQHRERAYLFHPEEPDAGGKTPAVKLTPIAVDGDIRDVIWNRKSDQLVVLAEAPNDAGDLGPAGSAWLIAANDPQHPKLWKEIPATVSSGAWSDDGEQFYFHAQSKADVPPGYQDIYAVSVKDNAVRDLTEGFNGSVGGEMIPDGQGMLAGIETGTRTNYGRIAAGNPGIASLNLAGTVVSGLATNQERNAWIYLRSSSTEPTTLCYAARLGDSPKTLVTPTLLPGKWPAVETKVVTWKSDGRTIEGLLSLPPDARPDHKVPLIVDVHGGPLGAWGDNYSPYAEFFVGHGWAILRPNPRGSTGQGAAFAAANKNDLGGGDYRDIMSGVDVVLQSYPIDADKLGLMGYSYGGEMAAFVEGKTDRFKAIVSGAPVIDQFSEYGTERGSWYDRWYFGKPWEHLEDAWRESPVSGAAKAKTPFLLLQGESDATDPLGQSQEMYRALRQMGVPVEMVQYPREDHGPLARGMFGNPAAEPWHGFDARQRIVSFFEKAFGGTQSK